MIRCYLGRPTTVPGRHTYTQDELAEALRRRVSALEGTRELCQMIGFIYAHAAIDQRHLEFTLDEIEARRDWYLLVNEATYSLAARALGQLRADVGTGPDALIVVSSSYAGFPALSRRLQAQLQLDPQALCYDLTGLGCAGPTHGLQLAQLLVSNQVARRVAVVCADAMGSHGESRVHHTPPAVSQVVAHCLASDGAAAMFVSAERLDGTDSLACEGCRLESRLWPDSLDENDFTATPDNQPMISVGKGIRTRLVDELGPLLDGLDPETSLFHPGGAALMRALGAANPALVPSLELSSGVLREHGNIGSASVLWVLASAWAAGRRLGPKLHLVALGPGIVSTKLGLEISSG